jgi:hypothetical protein
LLILQGNLTVAFYSYLRHNNGMDRKKRTDRNHLIYLVTCEDTGEQYVGLTIMRGRAIQKTAYTRLQQHQYRASTEKKEWKFSQALRKFANWSVQPLEVIRGKKEAHARELELINVLQPELNTVGSK